MVAKVIDRAEFADTGAVWEATDDGIVAVIFGNKRSNEAAVIAEAKWFSEQFHRLRERQPSALWAALVDLKQVSEDHRPPHEASEEYTHLLRDEALMKVALLHTTIVQKAIVAILLAPAFFADKVHYFASEAAARDWLRSAHPHGMSVNW